MIHVLDILFALPAIHNVFRFRTPANIQKIKSIGLILSNPKLFMDSIEPYFIDNILTYSIILNDTDYVVVDKSINFLGANDNASFDYKKFDAFRYDNVMNETHTNLRNNASHKVVIKTANLPTVSPLRIRVPMKILIAY
jgi:hypothetical protein